MRKTKTAWQKVVVYDVSRWTLGNMEGVPSGCLRKVFKMVQFFFYIQVFILAVPHMGSLVTACGIQFPNRGLSPGPLRWEHGVLATGPPGTPPRILL